MITYINKARHNRRPCDYIIFFSHATIMHLKENACALEREREREYPLRMSCQQEKVRKEDQCHGTWSVACHQIFSCLCSNQISNMGFCSTHMKRCLRCTKPYLPLFHLRPHKTHQYHNLSFNPSLPIYCHMSLCYWFDQSSTLSPKVPSCGLCCGVVHANPDLAIMKILILK